MAKGKEMRDKEKLHSIPLALTVLILFFLIFGSSVALAGTETRLTHGEPLTQSTAIYGNHVFWTENAVNYVHVYDLTTGKRTDISGNFACITKLIHTEIKSYGLVKVVMPFICMTFLPVMKLRSHRECELPDIYGNYIVYDSNNTDSIYLYNLNTHKETQITPTTTDYTYSSPAIDGTKVVWSQANSSNGYEICKYDISTNQTSIITDTNSSISESELDIYGNVVVWIESGNCICMI